MKVFKAEVLKDKLSSAEFNEVYQTFNKHLMDFVSKRRQMVEDYIEKIVTKELEKIDEGKRMALLTSIKQAISKHASELRMCPHLCYQCKLVCVSRSGHRYNIETERETMRVKMTELEKSIKANELS